MKRVSKPGAVEHVLDSVARRSRLTVELCNPALHRFRNGVQPGHTGNNFAREMLDSRTLRWSLHPTALLFCSRVYGHKSTPLRYFKPTVITRWIYTKYRERKLRLLCAEEITHNRWIVSIEVLHTVQSAFKGAEMNTHILFERQSNIVEATGHQPKAILNTRPDNHNLPPWLRHSLHLSQSRFASLLRLSGESRAREGDIYAVLFQR